MLGIGKKVEAKDTEEVGHCGEVFVAVIAVGGTGCIGAYFVKPVCRLYGVPQAPAALDEDFPVVPLSVAGPSVVVIAATCAATVVEKVPVIPVRVNRLE
jgi:hypothetical protein